MKKLRYALAPAVLTLALAASGCSSMTSTSSVLTAEGQAAMTPESVLAELKAGNARFASGNSTKYDWLAQAEATNAGGQYPKAIVLGCLDSRVPVEAIFDQGIGDVFVGRVAGNIEDEAMLGSMEFGTKVAGSRLIVVLGHTKCGAVMGAIDQVEMGNLTALLGEIDTSARQPGQTSKDADLVDRVIEDNVRRTVSDITARSPVMAELVRENKLMVVGAVYDLETGHVRWLDS